MTLLHFFRIIQLSQGRRFREDRGIVPLEKLGGGTEVLLSPPIFRKYLAYLHCKKHK